MNIEVFVVTFEDDCGEGVIKAFSNKKDANACLKSLLNEMYEEEYGDVVDQPHSAGMQSTKREFLNWRKTHGAFSGKVSKLRVIK